MLLSVFLNTRLLLTKNNQKLTIHSHLNRINPTTSGWAAADGWTAAELAAFEAAYAADPECGEPVAAFLARGGK